MLDAEIPEGDLTQVTAAIQNALKPSTTVIQQRLVSNTSGGALPSTAAESDADAENDLVDQDSEAFGEAPAAQKATRQRKPTAQKVLELDLTSGISLDDFAARHSAKNDVERNLIILVWFKEHRPDEIVTSNHVYTCYRALKWPSGIEDFSWPLRSLKKDQLVSSLGRGQYVVNHLGVARVEKLKSDQ